MHYKIVGFTVLVCYLAGYLFSVQLHIKTHPRTILFTPFQPIQSNNCHYLFMLIFRSHNRHFPADSKTSRQTKRWVYWWFYSFLFQLVYWTIVVFVKLVGYFISYFWSLYVHLKTFTHNLCLHCFNNFYQSLFFITTIKGQNVLC